MRSCHIIYSMRPQYTLSHRIVAQINPKSSNFRSPYLEKRHQHQRLLSSYQQSSSPPLEPPRHRSEPAPTHPNTAWTTRWWSYSTIGQPVPGSVTPFLFSIVSSSPPFTCTLKTSASASSLSPPLILLNPRSRTYCCSKATERPPDPSGPPRRSRPVRDYCAWSRSWLLGFQEWR